VSARLHNGFWFWKSALLLVNLYATFKVNISPAMNLLMIVGVFGGCMFLIIQLFWNGMRIFPNFCEIRDFFLENIFRGAAAPEKKNDLDLV